jgi:hypothetical protein
MDLTYQTLPLPGGPTIFAVARSKGEGRIEDAANMVLPEDSGQPSGVEA